MSTKTVHGCDMSTSSGLRYGTRVRERREELGISRERLAYEAAVSVSTVTRLELSDQLPNTASLLRIARVIDLTLDEIVADEAAS